MTPRDPWWQRPKIWAVLSAVVLAAIYLASMAATGPWDPWETHYGEVARQMLVRHDPVDLHWQGGNGGPDGTYEKTFWSKPALPFWLMALSMRLFGVGTSADPSEMVHGFLPELAIRLPSMLAGFASAAFLGWVLWRLVSPRAGVLAAIVLATMPQWAIVTRQALTDMFFVGPVVLAAGAWAMAWLTEDRQLKRKRRGRLSIPWDRAFAAYFVFFVVAAVVPLAVIHQHSFDPGTWARIGRSKTLATGMRDIQAHMFIYWALVAVVMVRSLTWRRRSQVWMGVLYLAAGVSLVGKGMIGPGLIGLVVLVHLIVSRRWKLLLVCGLPTGVVLFALAGFPWHHAMLLYRGEKFFSELIVVNNLQRFSSGEQEQAVGGFSYYLQTLGLGALPWVAVTPLALWAGVKAFAEPWTPSTPAADEGQSAELVARGRRAATHQFMLLWALASLFTLSYSVTKYYHYLLPCLPPLAALTGIWLDDALSAARRKTTAGVAVGCIIGVAVIIGVLRDLEANPAWLAHLTTYLYTAMWLKGAPDPQLAWWVCVPFMAGLLAWSVGRRRLGVAAFVLSSTLTTAWVIDGYLPAASENWSQRSMMRVYFDNRTDNDRIISWWFYYRGETYLTKADIWVLKDNKPQELREYMTAYANEHAGEGASIWIATLAQHGKRLRGQLPANLRAGYEVMYENFHCTLARVPIP